MMAGDICSHKLNLNIIFVVDTTGSMGSYAKSLPLTIKQIMAIINLVLQNRAKIAVVSYKDYCDGEKVCTSVSIGSSEKDVISFVDNLNAEGGGDAPEATKTALNYVIEMIKNAENSQTSQSIVIHYTDAPPHCKQSNSDRGNQEKEENHLQTKNPGWDWIDICKAFANLGVPVYSFITAGSCALTKVCMCLLGEVILLKDTCPYNVTKATMGMLLHIFGDEFAYDTDFFLCRIKDKEKILAHVKSESSADYPQIKSVDIKETEPFKFDYLSKITDLYNIKELLINYDSRETFRDLVFSTLSDMFTSEGCLALTYNPIIGKLWRLCCKQRGDSRLDNLKSKLSLALDNILDDKKKQQLRVWIENSYDQTEEITKLISNSLQDSPCLILDPAAVKEHYDIECLRSLARAPTVSGLKAAQMLLTHLILTENIKNKFPKAGDIPIYLPVCLSNVDLFGCLPHLLSRGMRFSLRGSLLLAILAHLSNNKYLAERARIFLHENIGKWIKLDKMKDSPELLSDENVKLINKIPMFTTLEEKTVYHRLFIIIRIRLALKKQFSLKVAHLPNSKYVYADYKLQCISCKHHRSFTLMTLNGKCGLCVFKEQDSSYEVIASSVDNCDQYSKLVTCKTCQSIYEVVRIQDLRVEPKCYYCRFNVDGHRITCVLCLNTYINPSNQFSSQEWKCPTCAYKPITSFENKIVCLEDIFQYNLSLISLFEFGQDSFEILIGNSKSFKIFTEHWPVISRKAALEPIFSLKIKGQHVHNQENLINQIKSEVLDGSLSEMCLLCCEEKVVKLMFPSPCGNCENLSCSECINRWVNQIQPGKVILQSHLVCPFCKNTPKLKVFERYNKLAKSLFHGSHIKNIYKRMNPDLYYGWCKGCAQIKEIGPMHCAVDSEIPFSSTDNFVCEDCEASMVKFLAISKCPGCQAPTIKSYGCNHIHCSQCESHWCYLCNKKFELQFIYDHLIIEHGSIGLE